jgi:hypothetical protein
MKHSCSSNPSGPLFYVETRSFFLVYSSFKSPAHSWASLVPSGGRVVSLRVPINQGHFHPRGGRCGRAVPGPRSPGRGPHRLCARQRQSLSVCPDPLELCSARDRGPGPGLARGPWTGDGFRGRRGGGPDRGAQPEPQPGADRPPPPARARSSRGSRSTHPAGGAAVTRRRRGGNGGARRPCREGGGGARPAPRSPQPGKCREGPGRTPTPARAAPAWIAASLRTFPCPGNLELDPPSPRL